MRILAAIAALAMAPGCTERGAPETARAQLPLIGGEVVVGDDPAVVALLTGNETICCTGTVVSPTVVVTAAHCLDASLCGDTDQLTIHFGDDTDAQAGMRIGVRQVQKHPSWTGSINSGRDIALLLLNFSVDPAVPVPLNTAPVEPMVGQPYRVSGFGIKNRSTGETDGKKRTGTVTITNALDDPPADEILINDSNTVICFGDSGGPGFVTVNDTEYIAGVHSWTSGNCFGPNGDTRVDLYANSFIRPWIQDNDPACGADGVCAQIGCSADPDCEPCGADGTCASNCPLPDQDCATSSIGEICQADTQCTSGLCVLWQDEPNAKFCSRPCTTSADDCPSPMSCQSVDPFGAICYFGGSSEPPGVLGSSCAEATDCGAYLCDEGECVVRCDLSIGQLCPAGFTCRTNDTTESYCHSGDGGGDDDGCLSAGHGDPGGAVLILIALAMRLGRRRHRARHRRPVRSS